MPSWKRKIRNFFAFFLFKHLRQFSCNPVWIKTPNSPFGVLPWKIYIWRATRQSHFTLLLPRTPLPLMKNAEHRRQVGKNELGLGQRNTFGNGNRRQDRKETGIRLRGLTRGWANERLAKTPYWNCGDPVFPWRHFAVTAGSDRQEPDEAARWSFHVQSRDLAR